MRFKTRITRLSRQNYFSSQWSAVMKLLTYSLPQEIKNGFSRICPLRGKSVTASDKQYYHQATKEKWFYSMWFKKRLCCQGQRRPWKNSGAGREEELLSKISVSTFLFAFNHFADKVNARSLYQPFLIVQFLMPQVGWIWSVFLLKHTEFFILHYKMFASSYFFHKISLHQSIFHNHLSSTGSLCLLHQIKTSHFLVRFLDATMSSQPTSNQPSPSQPSRNISRCPFRNTLTN